MEKDIKEIDVFQEVKEEDIEKVDIVVEKSDLEEYSYKAIVKYIPIAKEINLKEYFDKMGVKPDLNLVKIIGFIYIAEYDPENNKYKYGYRELLNTTDDKGYIHINSTSDGSQNLLCFNGDILLNNTKSFLEYEMNDTNEKHRMISEMVSEKLYVSLDIESGNIKFGSNSILADYKAKSCTSLKGIALKIDSLKIPITIKNSIIL